MLSASYSSRIQLYTPRCLYEGFDETFSFPQSPPSGDTSPEKPTNPQLYASLSQKANIIHTQESRQKQAEPSPTTLFEQFPGGDTSKRVATTQKPGFTIAGKNLSLEEVTLSHGNDSLLPSPGPHPKTKAIHGRTDDGHTASLGAAVILGDNNNPNTQYHINAQYDMYTTNPGRTLNGKTVIPDKSIPSSRTDVASLAVTRKESQQHENGNTRTYQEVGAVVTVSGDLGGASLQNSVHDLIGHGGVVSAPQEKTRGNVGVIAGAGFEHRIDGGPVSLTAKTRATFKVNGDSRLVNGVGAKVDIPYGTAHLGLEHRLAQDAGSAATEADGTRNGKVVVAGIEGQLGKAKLRLDVEHSLDNPLTTPGVGNTSTAKISAGWDF